MLYKGVLNASCTGLIHPNFKAGGPDDPSNSRGVAVVVILAKLYAMVLEARASARSEHWKCKARGQAGFRKQFRTTDQGVVMQALTQQAKPLKRKLYTCFDYHRKELDLIPRCTFRKGFVGRGMGKVLTSLRSMYAADKACVLTKDGSTE